MRKILLLFSFFFILPSFPEFVSYSVSKIYFQDNFSSLNNTNWSYSNSGGTIDTGDDGLTLSASGSRNFPFVYSIKNIFPEEGNYTIKVNYQFPVTTSFGVGFGIGNLVPNYPIISYSDPEIERKFVYFDIWQSLNDKHLLQTKNCVSETICDTFRTNLFLKQPTSNIHSLTIRFVDDHFEVEHVSGNSGIEVIENKVLTNSKRRPTVFWIGNPFQLQTENNWTKIRIMQITVTREEDEKDPIVILPGFGGSWDIDAVLTNKPGNNWKIPEFVKEYDGIIKSLKNAGYEENKDLFIFAYDWRKPLDSLADDLNAFLISKDISTKKTSLVGHSMGGLVARSYLQKYDNPNIQKIITAGSPHKGIIDAYGMWEGLTVWDGVWWQKALHLVATEVNRSSGETELQAARRVSPSVKDLLPTSDFLQKDEQTIPISKMAWKNDYLLDKNNNVLNFAQRVFSGFSSDYQSKNKLLVTKPTKEDNLRGLWQDGKPIKANPFLFAFGDGYVTSKSSGEIFDKKISLVGNHGEVISKKENIVKILEELEVATVSAVGSNSDTRKKLMVFKLNSPGTLEVCQASVCDTNLGLVFVDKKMIIVPGFAEGNFDVKVKSFGEMGNYQLQIGEINETAEWSESYGKLTDTDQVDSYTYNTVNNQTVADKITNDKNITLYFPLGVDLKNINKLRQDLLRQMDVNIGLKNTQGFDLLIDKWIALDNYVSSLDQKKTKGMNHKDWSEHNNNGFIRSRFITKIPDYFTERLVDLYTDLEAVSVEYYHADNFYRIDKKMQLKMLDNFLRL